MKNRKALNALWCVPLMAGCAANPENRGAALDVQPVYSVRHSSENPEMLYQLGRYYQGQKRYGLALEAYERAAKANPDFAEARNGKGVILAKQGRYDQAIAEFKAALEHAPRAAHIHNNLGYAYYLQGQYQNAASAMEQAVALEPNNPRAHNNLGLAYSRIGSGTLAQQELAKGTEAGMPAAAPAVVAAAAEPAAAPVVEAPATAPVSVAVAAEKVAAPAQAPVPVAEVPVAAGQPVVAAAEPAQMLAVPKDAGVIRQVETATPPAREAASPAVRAAPARVQETAARPAETLSVATQAVAKADPVLPQQNGALRIEISNGNGVTGMARKVGGFLKVQGYPVRRITNDKPFSKPYTYVYYREGYRDEALRLRADLPYTLMPIEDGKMLRGIHVRVVLGKDMVQQLAHFEGGKTSADRLVVASKPAPADGRDG